MREITVLERIHDLYASAVFTRTELGMTGRQITDAVRAGTLLRLRRDRYATPLVLAEAAEAVRVGGRIACLSVLRLVGIFILEDSPCLHVHLPPGASRIRHPRAGTARLHWQRRSLGPAPLHVVALEDAIVQAVRCQTPRAAIATLDSLLHHRVLTMNRLRELFTLLPARFGALLPLIDGTAESGPETFMRLILRTLGVRFEAQVVIAGIGRVDFLVEGWLIIECDSRAFHEGWRKQVEDRHRDLTGAEQGYVTIRPLAADLMHEPGATRDRIARVITVLGPCMRAAARARRS